MSSLLNISTQPPPSTSSRLGRVCKLANCSFCLRLPCGVCGSCKNPLMKNKCKERYLCKFYFYYVLQNSDVMHIIQYMNYWIHILHFIFYLLIVYKLFLDLRICPRLNYAHRLAVLPGKVSENVSEKENASTNAAYTCKNCGLAVKNKYNLKRHVSNEKFLNF